jgi:hypothetical protein
LESPAAGGAYVAADLIQECLGKPQDVFWTVADRRQGHLSNTPSG